MKSMCVASELRERTERGVYAASLSLLLQRSLNSNLVGSFTLKRPEGRAPTNLQLVDAPKEIRMPEIERTDRAWLGFVGYLDFGIPLTFVIRNLQRNDAWQGLNLHNRLYHGARDL